jgi:pimeloyl-ACP methyl ester carboxylesterase
MGAPISGSSLESMPFVLVHGGGFDSRCWSPLIPLLDREGYAVDLPGRGATPGDLASVTVADFVDTVADEIVERDLHDVVLVGHSLAGITLPGVAERVEDRLRNLVFLSCSIPAPGTSVLDMLGDLSPTLAEVASRIGDEIVGPEGGLHPDFAAAMMCNDMGDEQRRLTLSWLVPEALGVVSEPVNLDGLRLPIPRTYIRLRQDQSLLLEKQTEMAQRLGADARILDIDAGHMVMISRPVALAEMLNQL